MFRCSPLSRSEVERFETPYNENFVEVRLTDLSVNPTGDSSWSPVHCVLPARYSQFADRIRNFTVYEDDVWIVTFPKAGTTWTQEMLWLIDHDLDYETASKVNLLERSVFFEVFAFVTKLDVPDTISAVEHMPRPRHIKTHLPLALLPKQLWTVRPKVVYTTRNAKDVATSFMHHYKYLHGFKGPREDYLDGVLAERLTYCPLVQHTTEFWRVAEHRPDHVLFLHFEDMKRDLQGVLQRVCDFFGKSFSREQMDRLESHLSFENMKGNSSANNQLLVTQSAELMGLRSIEFQFMRKGEVGSYKSELSEEFVKKLEQNIENQLKNTNFKYKE